MAREEGFKGGAVFIAHWAVLVAQGEITYGSNGIWNKYIYVLKKYSKMVRMFC